VFFNLQNIVISNPWKLSERFTNHISLPIDGLSSTRKRFIWSIHPRCHNCTNVVRSHISVTYIDI